MISAEFLYSVLERSKFLDKKNENFPKIIADSFGSNSNIIKYDNLIKFNKEEVLRAVYIIFYFIEINNIRL